MSEGTPQYLRGDGAAGRYLGYHDKQGRKFRAWAKRAGVPCAVIGGQRVYRVADLDAAWAAAAKPNTLRTHTSR